METIQNELHGAVRTVTLNRPEKRNALDGEMLDGLYDIFSAQPEGSERVVVLRSEGSVFCAGLDLVSRTGVSNGTSSIETMLHALAQYPLPVVGVVQGDAIAGGNELALHCDIVVASDRARFGMSLAQIGLCPTWFLTKKLVELAGPVTTRELLLLGDPLPAPRMCELGVIARSVPHDELQDTADQIVTRLADNAPLSLIAMKGLLNRLMDYRDGIDHAAVDLLVGKASSSEDAREGVAARMQKRPAEFKGA
ncbi:MAG: enoyl-CoA hydratase/isomerase family protein [Pseudomonadales bacterium]|nr:enoyl-CoA hydratase/isomerase family protein [Pseudomonadales bacterium]MDP7358840.1 enoyl-CoA hydratase/isomerase family protein [Pseudomonadales bacterium]MDP7594380.1 enoyl-CoA hydratase/isomerase family protein [Pseudomonadales bacterium]HJN49065.1 enoyl-CoA hydratase/isomerase family protein [Pseudomonadales bacterium]